MYVLDENGNIKVGKNGHPLVLIDGKEVEVDAIGAQEKINTIVAESNDRRKKLGEANRKLEAFTPFEGMDIEKVKDALTKVETFDKDITKAQDAIRDNLNKVWETKEEDWQKTEKELNDKLFQSTTGSRFATSQVIKKTLLPPDVAQSTFGNRFQPDGSALDKNGTVIQSVSKPGYPASFDESIEFLINERPDKDSIWKATSGNGGDSFNNGNGGGGDTQNMTARDKISAGLQKAGM